VEDCFFLGEGVGRVCGSSSGVRMEFLWWTKECFR
jgi:hypothetical protein